MQEKLLHAVAAGWKEIQLSFSKKLHITTVESWTELKTCRSIKSRIHNPRYQMADSQVIQHLESKIAAQQKLVPCEDFFSLFFLLLLCNTKNNKHCKQPSKNVKEIYIVRDTQTLVLIMYDCTAL